MRPNDQDTEISAASKAMMDAVCVNSDFPKDQAEVICISGVKQSFPFQPKHRLRTMFDFYWKKHKAGEI